MQDISDESDEATSHPIERVPSLYGAAEDRDIVDFETLEQMAVDGNTAFVIKFTRGHLGHVSVPKINHNEVRRK